MKTAIQNSFFQILTVCLLQLLTNSTDASVFEVDSKGDTDDLAAYTAGDGTNTLRKCIRLANANAGLDNINFSIPAGDAPFIITAGTALPAITSPVIINGLTQPGAAAGNLLIEIDGGGVNVLELTTGSDGSTIQGLVIYGANRGIYLWNSSNNSIVANHIGINAEATAAAASTILWNGIEIENGSNNTIIGGTSGLSTRNIISGCGEQGIRVQGNSSGTQIIGNYIGTDINGTAAIPNGQNGILLLGGSHNSVIGGATANHRNIISGNGQRGMLIENSTSCLVQNNYIGTTISGNIALGNLTRGIEAVNNSHNLQVLDNIICSNGQHGLSIANSERPIIKGNRIGLALNGAVMLGNGEHGMEIINSFKPMIGGSLPTERNYVSNNNFFGIRIDNGDSAMVKGNYIGVDETGLLDHGNGQVGLGIAASDDITIGGSVNGEGNVISGNGQHGISIAWDPTENAVIKGNIIGLGADLTTSIGNGQLGIELSNCENSTIGGSTLAERNYIAMSGGDGVSITNSPYTVVKGNYIGVDGTGLLNRGNNGNSLRVANSREVIIGGGSALERNIVCASVTANGIVLDGDSKRCTIQGNFVGVGADGTTDLGHWSSGIYLLSTSDTATIGGSSFMERNVSSCNGKSGVGDGIRIEGPDGHTILGNFSGVDSTGTLAKGNAWAGISLNESTDNIVGGAGAFEGNVCSANLNEGMWLRNALRNQIYGNFIGTDRTGTLQLGNEDWGLAISAAGPNFDNIIGGSPANANTIAYNQNIAGSGSGVDVSSDSHRNLITFNKIYCNAGLGIRLVGTANESIPAPVVTSSLANTVNGTGTAGYTVHIYRNITSDGGIACDCEGEVYIGNTTVDGGGNWSFTHNLGLSAPDALAVTATQTNGTNSTSQFSTCNPPMPVIYLYFHVVKVNNEDALLSWATSWEENNKEFIVERSYDGVNFTQIGKVSGNGNASISHSYSFLDQNPGGDIVYYRITQIDFDGTSSFSPVKTISFESSPVQIISLPEKEIRILADYSYDNEISIIIYSSNGQLCYQEHAVISGSLEKTINLTGFSSGIYLVKIISAENNKVEKVEIK